MIFLGDCAELIKSLDHLPAGERKQDIHINGATAIRQDIFFLPQDIVNLSKNNSFSYYCP